MHHTSFLMSPNSVDPMINLTANSHATITKSENVPPAEKQPIMMTPEKKFNKEERPEEAGARADGDGGNEDEGGFGEFLNIIAKGDSGDPIAVAGKEDAQGDYVNNARGKDKAEVSNDDAYIGCVGESSPAQEEAMATSLTAADIDEPPQAPEEAAAASTTHDNADDTPARSNDNEKPSDLFAPEGDAVGKDEKNESLNQEKLEDDPPQRRASNENKDNLHSTKILDSITSVDSWGGEAETLPPLLGNPPQRDTCPDSSTINIENDICNDNNATDGSSPSRVVSPKGNALDSEEGEDGLEYVNISKLLEPSSSEYYYSKANRNNRQMLNKVMSKKKMKRNTSLDESHHSRVSLISASSYRGPAPLKRDGSSVKGIIKNSRQSLLSIESMPSIEENSDEPKAKPMKRCSFSSVNIREHERIAGDNPCVTSGVPLSIGWGYYQHDSIDLDDYEFNKGPPRDKIEMMVPAGVRRSMLREDFGVSISEMNAAMKEVNITKRRRRTTVSTEHLEGWQEAAQSAKRKFKRLLKKTSTAKEEEKMWSQARKNTMSEYLKTRGEGSSGKNPESAGVGKINNGPKIAPATGRGAPPIEISFQNGEDRAPSF